MNFRYIALSQSLLIMFFTFFGIWIIFMTKKRKSRHQNVTSKRFTINQLLILALFCAHFLVGFSRFSYHVMVLSFGKNKLAQIFDLGLMFFVGIEIIFTTFIPIERYFTIRFPFHFVANETFYRKLYMIIAPLTFVLLIGGLMYVFGFIIPVAFNMLGVLLILVCNFLLFRIIRQQTKKIIATTVDKAAAVISTTSSRQKDDLENRCKENEENRRQKLQRRSFKICAFMTLTYVFLWIPYFILRFLYDSNRDLYRMYFEIISVLAFLNPIIDVLIYLSWNTDTRKTLKSIFCKGKSSVRESSQVTNTTTAFQDY